MEMPPEYLDRVIETVKRDHSLPLLPVHCIETEDFLRMYRSIGMGGCTRKPLVVEAGEFQPVDEFGSQWHITLEYSIEGYRAVYGIKPDGRPELYAD